MRFYQVRWHHCAANKLWHDYLVFQCRDKRNTSVASYAGIRETADALWRHIHSEGGNDNVHVPDWDQFLDRLCWLAVGCDEKGNCMQYYGRRWCASYLRCNVLEWWYWAEWTEPQQYGPGRTGSINTGLMLLSAATYFGYTSLVKELLDQGHDPTKCDDVFPSPMYIAAWTNRADILLLLQEHLPDSEECRQNVENRGDDYRILQTRRFNTGPGSLHGAAAQGNMNTVRLCLYPPSRNRYHVAPDGEDKDKYQTEEAETLIVGYKPGFIPHDSKLGIYIDRAMQRTCSPRVYDYLLSLLFPLDRGNNPDSAVNDGGLIPRHLAAMSGTGDITMVRHLLDHVGADPSSKDSSSPKPLVRAITMRNYDVIDLLLSSGADPNGREKLRYCYRTPLLAAVKTGNVRIVQKIFDAGAKVQFLSDEGLILRYAIEMEHTAMVELLLGKGIVSSEIAKSDALWKAEKMGLESMVDLLKSKGTKLSPWMSPPRPWVQPRHHFTWADRAMQSEIKEYWQIVKQHSGISIWVPPTSRNSSLPSLSQLRY